VEGMPYISFAIFTGGWTFVY